MKNGTIKWLRRNRCRHTWCCRY